MASFDNFYTLNKDKRVRKIKINIFEYIKSRYPNKIYLLLHAKDLNKETILWMGRAPLETMLNFYPYQMHFFKNTKQSANYLNIFLKNNIYFYFVLFLKLSTRNVYFPLDLSFLTNHFHTILSCYEKRYFLNLMVYSNDNIKSIVSLSPIYRSFVWVERETKEFSSITIHKLLDSRRLLTDYTVFKSDDIKYQTNSYNLLINDIL